MNPYSTEELDEMSFIDPERAFGFETLASSLHVFHGWSWAWFVRR
jgi:hypothetical protein